MKPGREVLKKLLPNDYKYGILSINIYENPENIENEVQLDAEFGVTDVNSKEEFQIWLKKFSEITKTFYNCGKRADWAKVSSVCEGIRKCHFNIRHHDPVDNNRCKKDGCPSQTGKMKNENKQTECDAEIRFEIRKSCEFDCKKHNKQHHEQRIKFPLWIKLHYYHNHTIESSEAQKWNPVSEETKNFVNELLDNNMSLLDFIKFIFFLKVKMIL